MVTQHLMKKEDVLEENHCMKNLEKQVVESSMNMRRQKSPLLMGKSSLTKLLKEYVQNNPLTLPSWIYLTKSLVIYDRRLVKGTMLVVTIMKCFPLQE